MHKTIVLYSLQHSLSSMGFVGRRFSILGNRFHIKYPFSNATVFSTSSISSMPNNQIKSQRNDDNSEVPSQKNEVKALFDVIAHGNKYEQIHAILNSTGNGSDFRGYDPNSWDTNELKDYFQITILIYI